jgi:hypothetical protein
MECPDCHYVFKSQGGFKHHVSEKICMKRYNTCNHCGKHFTDKRNYMYHTNNHVCDKIQLKLKTKVDEVDKIDNQQTITRLTEENLHLKGQLEALIEHPQTINNTKINIIVPPAFLAVDNYQHLSQQLPNLLHQAISKHPANCITYLIKETNCNPNLPIYNSVKITNKKDDYIQISNGKNFVYASKKKIISQLIENKRHILQEYVDNNGDKYGEIILKRYQNYVDLLDDEDKTAQKDLEVDIICMLLNISNLIGSDEWSKKLLNDLKIGCDSDDEDENF